MEKSRAGRPRTRYTYRILLEQKEQKRCSGLLSPKKTAFERADFVLKLSNQRKREKILTFSSIPLLVSRLSSLQFKEKSSSWAQAVQQKLDQLAQRSVLSNVVSLSFALLACLGDCGTGISEYCGQLRTSGSESSTNGVYTFILFNITDSISSRIGCSMAIPAGQEKVKKNFSTSPFFRGIVQEHANCQFSRRSQQQTHNTYTPKYILGKVWSFSQS